MPYVNIEIEEIYGELNSSDKENLVEWLKEDGYISKRDTEFTEPQSAVEQLFEKDIDKIRIHYLTMSREDMDTINQIAKKY